MGAESKIEWTDATFNPWWGCQRVSPGCENCYAETFAKRVGLKVWGPTSERRFFGEKHWAEPLKWNRQAEREGRRARVFCASMADVFEDREDLVVPRGQLWYLIALTPWLDWLLLTKRPQNVARMVPWGERGTHRADPTCWRNVWLGTTCEDQKRAEERIPHLLDVPAVVHFVSYEPALGPIDLENVEPYYVQKDRHPHDPDVRIDALRGHMKGPDDVLDARVDWVIVGGESGVSARPFDLAWARSVVAQCKGAGVACFVKQLGSNPHGEWGDTNAPKAHVTDSAGGSWTEENRFKNGRWRLRDRKGGSPSEWPSDLRVREFPRIEVPS